jgi:integrase/recombinase XerD
MAQIFSPVEPETEIQSVTQDQALCEYAQYMERERGLTAGTIRRCSGTIRDLLEECFGSELVLWDQMHAEDVTRFLLRSTEHVTSNAAKKTASHLRQFLRYLQARGKISQNLAGAVLPVASREEVRSLPCFLEPEEVRHLLASCDQTSVKGQRDHAILLLLARLGLRSCEVVAMELSDIDWRAGELTIRGKGPRLDRLPLPQDVGETLASYLREARPMCASTRVFLRLRPSVQGFSGSSAISDLVSLALRRAGLSPKRRGAHLLRHSLATEMVRKGARLSEIGQILRHRRSSTTEIYARVDLPALRELVQPWPGGEV